MFSIVSSSAMAEWDGVRHANQQVVNFNVYVDPVTIRKSGNNVSMWILNDFSTALIGLVGFGKWRKIVS